MSDPVKSEVDEPDILGIAEKTNSIRPGEIYDMNMNQLAGKCQDIRKLCRFIMDQHKEVKNPEDAS